jgi:hypothetical protein
MCWNRQCSAGYIVKEGCLSSARVYMVQSRLRPRLRDDRGLHWMKGRQIRNDLSFDAILQADPVVIRWIRSRQSPVASPTQRRTIMVGTIRKASALELTSCA